MTGIITEIHRTSVVDGPGIRTTVFTKGCPLGCLWCHNPETQSAVCEYGYGRRISSDDLVKECLKDKIYYEESEGGVTLSGGEPMQQLSFVIDLLKKLKKNEIRTALDTSGYAKTKDFEATLDLTDLYLFDFKASPASQHRELTGVDSDLILHNLDFLMKAKASVIFRCPLIPGINDDEEHLDAISEMESRYPELLAIHILPWHTMGRIKYTKLGKKMYPGLPEENTSQECLEKYKAFFAGKGNRKVIIQSL